MNKNYFMLMMGGVGSRFGADCPKQFVEINGRPIFSFILEKINNIDCVDGIVIVCHKSWVEYVKKHIDNKFNKVISIVSGGDCRSKSVLNGLSELRKHISDDDIVLIHDATHPHLDEKKLLDVIKKTNEIGAATMASSIFDTCYFKNIDSGTIEKVVDRKLIAVGASPESFKFGIIYPIYLNATNEELEKMTSAGAALLSRGLKMAIVESDLLNLKITYPEDMTLFKILLPTYYYND